MMTQITLGRRSRLAATGALLALATSLTACAGLGANDVPRSQAGQVSRVEAGTVIEQRQVRLEGTRSGIGAGTGAVVGGVVGSQIGGGDAERAVAGVLGAVGGGLLGAATESRATAQVGIAYTIRLERTGEVISIAQAADIVIPVGAPVWVEYGPRARVVPR